MNRMFTAACFALVALAMAGPLSAEKNYGMAGCGLGSVLISADSGRFLQIPAATTNGTSLNQSFGITSGTLNCTDDTAAYKQMQQEFFASVNFNALSQEMAAGSGERLAAFASLLGCPAERSGAFASLARKNHERIFGSQGITPAGMLSSVRNIVQKDPELAQACQI